MIVLFFKTNNAILLSKKKLLSVIIFIGCLFFFCLNIQAQERMTEYKKNFISFDSKGGINKLHDFYVKKYKSSKNELDLAYARYSEIYLYKKDTLENIKRAYDIIRYSDEKSELRSRAYFWAAVFLENSALDLSMYYLKKASKLNEEYNYELEKILTYHVIGRLYYKKKEYKHAIFYFQKALAEASKKNDLLNMSSMYNNIGLVYDKLKNYPQAISFAKKSIQLLTKPQDVFFLNVVRTNIGNYYFKMNNYKDAEDHYAKAFEYYYKIRDSKDELSSTVPNLYTIYENNPSKREPFIKKVKEMLDDDKTSPFNITLLKVIQDNAFNKGAFDEAKEISGVLNEYTLEYKRLLNKRHADTSNLLAQYISEEFASEQKIQQQKDLINYISTIAILLMISGGGYYAYRIKNLEKKDAILQREFLEKENSWMQERISYIQLNLDLKTKTEQELLKRLKDLRKPNQKSAQEVVKELYLSISNLLQIDKRRGESYTVESEDTLCFIEKLKARCSILTAQEIKLCTYLRLPITSKEAASFMESTPGAIRVAKTKIKQKLNLPREQKLDDFLKAF